jgi:integrase
VGQQNKVHLEFSPNLLSGRVSGRGRFVAVVTETLLSAEKKTGIDSEKTGMRVGIPMLAPLKATIETGPTGDLAFAVTRRGTPFNKGALGTAFVEAARAAGVRGKSAHGLRNTAATRVAENGATERELEAIFGWSEGADGDALHASANRSRLAAGAIGKLDRAETENRTSIIPSPTAEVREKSQTI